MIETINITKYLKFKKIILDFNHNVNVISGGNGTCKTSLLYIISNSFKKPTLKTNPSLKLISHINKLMNPKVESLAKSGVISKNNIQSGELFKIKYNNKDGLIPFRVKYDGDSNRYRIIPSYARGKKENLPAIPVIYLGLPRLVPTGEVPDNTAITNVDKFLPEEYMSQYREYYYDFCNIRIKTFLPQENIANIKTRPAFKSDINGVDSDTISAGQDNIQILLTALLSLKYFYDNSAKTNQYESVLLIDELDATLHPTIQYKILNLICEFSKDYKIQVFFTTHSISLLEYSITKKCNILYLIDNTTPETKSGSITLLPEPTLKNISLFLQNKMDNGKYKLKKIPVLTEDNEARILLTEILAYKRKENYNFAKIESSLHMTEFNIGSQTLKQMNDDEVFFQSLMPSITILDGDERPSKNEIGTYRELKKNYAKKNIIFLPSNKSPEKLIFDYSILAFNKFPDFWENRDVLSHYITKEYYREHIRNEIEGIDALEAELNSNEESSKGKIRKRRKSHFKAHENFFKLLFRHWLANPDNESELNEFILDLKDLFKKVCSPHGIDPNIWPN